MTDSECGAILLYAAVGLPRTVAEAFSDAMEMLPKMLLRSPLGVEVRFGRMTDALVADVLRILRSAADDLAIGNGRLLNFLADRYQQPPEVALGCAADHPLAIAAQRNKSDAEWGSYYGPLMLMYRARNRHLVWHEALHALGAKDCYSLPNRGPTCERFNCIMQYVPNEATVGTWPFLCDNNSRLVRERVRAFAAAATRQ